MDEQPLDGRVLTPLGCLGQPPDAGLLALAPDVQHLLDLDAHS